MRYALGSFDTLGVIYDNFYEKAKEESCKRIQTSACEMGKKEI